MDPFFVWKSDTESMLRGSPQRRRWATSNEGGGSPSDKSGVGDYGGLHMRISTLIANETHANEGEAPARKRGRSPNGGTARVHVSLPEDLSERLFEVQRETFASSAAEVIKNALVVYVALLEEHKQGRQVFTQSKDKSDPQRLAIFL